ncbi:LysM domain-containing protein [Alicyclobacillus tolerans]|uniref:LysM peptidoglycan-binding domain-containing protein n=1 Tax=Alicyclobacillus tolerans TaxID=90970 RepID=UPI001F3E4D8D|nr:LysM domain-containing protein [Alicyclobacillus tolerans]MCF8564159.1 LysM domain-containing protein [Alicyclobacillus tolerans]
MVRYIVQSGDTLGTIAAKYDTTVQAIVQANGIKNPNMIHKGQILRIPTHHYEDSHKYHGHHGHHYHSSHEYTDDHDDHHYNPYNPSKHY